MYDKDPNTLFALFEAIPESVKGAVMAFVVAMLRLAYDNQEPNWLRRILEGFICSFLAYGIYSLTRVMEWSTDLAFVGSVMVGFLGADFVKEKAKTWFTKKSDQI